MRYNLLQCARFVPQFVSPGTIAFPMIPVVATAAIISDRDRRLCMMILNFAEKVYICDSADIADSILPC